MTDISNLSKEISRSGFALEWQTTAIFDALGYDIEQNFLLRSSSSEPELMNRLVEIDVFARSKRVVGAEGYVVECKGAKSSDKLVLVPTPKRRHSIPAVYFESGGVTLRENENILCDNEIDDLPSMCHTGDFFLCDGDKFKKAAKQEEKSNLYHAVYQLYFATDAIFLHCQENDSLKIFPTIVTNAEIRLVDFDFSSRTPSHETYPVPWVAYRNPLYYSRTPCMLSSVPWRYQAGSYAENDGDMNRIPAIWIVQLDHLAEFILSPGKQLPK